MHSKNLPEHPPLKRFFPEHSCRFLKEFAVSCRKPVDAGYFQQKETKKTKEGY